MNENRVFYQLKPGTMDACNLTKSARADAERTWRCPSCGSPRPGTEAIDVQIEQSEIKDGPLNLVFDGVALALRSFLAQLGKDVINRDLMLGRVFGPDGNELEEWCTYRSRREIIVRGADERAGPDYPVYNVCYRCCNACGHILYGALLDKYHYLYPTPPQDAEVFQDSRSLVVPDYLFSRLEVPKKARIYVDRLEVLDAPLDGFGVLEPWEPDRSKWGIRHRTMRGHTCLTDFVLRQGQEDLDARKNGYYTSIIWHFFPDPESGQVDIAPELLQSMERSGINCTIHD